MNNGNRSKGFSPENYLYLDNFYRIMFLKIYVYTYIIIFQSAYLIIKKYVSANMYN